MEAFATVLSLCQTLHKIGNAAQARNEDLKSLADLARMVQPVVHKLKLKYHSGSDLDPTLELYLSNLKEALMDAQRIVKKLQSSNSCKMYLKGDKAKRARERIKDILECEWTTMQRFG